MIDRGILKLGETVPVLLLSVLSTSIYAIWIGQDMNWDLRNYHFVNSYNFIHEKSFTNIAVADIQSWLNPILNVPAYLLIQHFPPIVVGAVLGALSGINIFLLYIITRLLAGTRVPRHSSIVLGLISAFFGLSSPIFLSMVGTTFTDNLCSLFVLGSVLIAISDYFDNRLKLFLSSSLLGIATGFKLTNAFYGLSFIITCTILCYRSNLKFKDIGYALIGSMIGFLVTSGYWCIQVWQIYGNPVFPFYNKIFQSPFFDLVNLKDLRFLPESLIDAIVYPFQWLTGHSPTTEPYFRDARFALISILFPAFVISLLKSARSGSQISFSANHDTAIFSLPYFWLMSIFFIISYSLWLSTFSIHRYIVGLELLSGLIIIMLLDRMIPDLRLKLIASAVACAFCAIWGQPANWDRVNYKNDWFELRLDNTVQDNTLFIMFIDQDPLGYIVPFFPPSTRFVALQSGILTKYDNAFGKKIKSIISSHTGSIRSVSTSFLSKGKILKLRQFGLMPAAEYDCYPFRSRVNRFISCGLVKIADIGSQAQADAQPILLLGYELGKLIKFTVAGTGPDFFLYGWSLPEEWGTWTKRKEAALGLRLSRHPLNDLVLTMSARAFVNRAHPKQDIDITVNNVKLTQERFTENSDLAGLISVTIPARLVRKENGNIIIEIRLPDAISPKDLSLSSDTRRLGIGLISLEISEKQ